MEAIGKVIIQLCDHVVLILLL